MPRRDLDRVLELRRQSGWYRLSRSYIRFAPESGRKFTALLSVAKCQRQTCNLGAPKHIPSEIVATLNTEINAGLANSTIKARLADLGSTPLVGSATDFGKLIADETEKWGNVIQALNIKAD